MHILADFSTNPNSLQAKEVISYERSTCVTNACMFVLFIVPEKRKPPVPEVTKPPAKKKRRVVATTKQKQQSKAPVDNREPGYYAKHDTLAGAAVTSTITSNFEDPCRTLRECTGHSSSGEDDDEDVDDWKPWKPTKTTTQVFVIHVNYFYTLNLPRYIFCTF